MLNQMFISTTRRLTSWIKSHLGWALTLGAALMLSACQSLAPVAPQHDIWPAGSPLHEVFEASGRMSVNFNQQHYYALFTWQKNHNYQQFSIKTPLGNTLAVLCEDGTGALVSNAQAVQQGESLQAVAKASIGVALPFRELAYWVWGEREPGDFQVLNSGNLSQNGWEVQRETLAHGAIRLRANWAKNGNTIQSTTLISTLHSAQNLPTSCARPIQ